MLQMDRRSAESRRTPSVRVQRIDSPYAWPSAPAPNEKQQSARESVEAYGRYQSAPSTGQASQPATSSSKAPQSSGSQPSSQLYSHTDRSQAPYQESAPQTGAYPRSSASKFASAPAQDRWQLPPSQSRQSPDAAPAAQAHQDRRSAPYASSPPSLRLSTSVERFGTSDGPPRSYSDGNAEPSGKTTSGSTRFTSKLKKLFIREDVDDLRQMPKVRSGNHWSDSPTDE